MQIIPLKLPGTFEIRPKIIGDARGYFSETYLKNVFEEHGLSTEWVQENRALSSRVHTLRGFHFQRPPAAQTKLVSMAEGTAFDVFVDIRPGSVTYGKWDSIVLDAGKCNAVYVPQGFAHGYCTLSETAVVQYKVDHAYSPEDEGGIRWNDPDLRVEWPAAEPVLSDRDRELPFLKDLS